MTFTPGIVNTRFSVKTPLPIEIKFTNWTDFKNGGIARNLLNTLQYEQIDAGTDADRYILSWQGITEKSTFTLRKSNSQEDFDDFENNYKNNSNQPLDRRAVKYEASNSSVTLSCNPTTFVTFYTIDLPDLRELYEIVVRANDDEIIAIEIDSVIVKEVNVGLLYPFFESIAGGGLFGGGETTQIGNSTPQDISISTGADGDFFVRMALNREEGKQIKILQKRLSGTGTGNETLEGYILFYREGL